MHDKAAQGFLNTWLVLMGISINFIVAWVALQMWSMLKKSHTGVPLFTAQLPHENNSGSPWHLIMCKGMKIHIVCQMVPWPWSKTTHAITPPWAKESPAKLTSTLPWEKTAPESIRPRRTMWLRWYQWHTNNWHWELLTLQKNMKH